MIKKIMTKILTLCIIMAVIFLNLSFENIYADNEVTITFVRNWGNNLSGAVGNETETYTHTFQVGDKLPGNNVFGSDLITEAGPIRAGRSWLYVGSAIDFLSGNSFGRTYAWNSASDGSGKFYRGSQTVTADMDGLVLYQSWVNAEDSINLADNINNSDLYKVDIKLNQGDYENSANPNNSEYDDSLPYPNYVDGIGDDDNIPYKVDQAMSLKYRSVLDFTNSKKYLAVLWGRIDKVRSMHGTMTAKFDARLKFDKNINVSYESSWLEPDEARLQQYGVVNVTTQQIDNSTYRHTFTISSDYLNGNIQTIQGVDYKVAVIPVTGAKDLSNKKIDGELKTDLIELKTLRNKFNNLSFEDFMKNMQLSVADDFDRGVNAIIDRESYNRIANGTNPVVITKGSIELTIDGEFSGYEETYTMSSIANDEMAKLYPTGIVEIDYKEIGTNIPLSATQDGDIDENENKTVLIGRSKHDVNSSNPSSDPEDVSNPYEVKVPVIPGYTFVGVQTEGKQEVDKKLTGVFNHSITPKVTLLYQKNGVLDVKYVIKGTNTEIKTGITLVEKEQTLSSSEYRISGGSLKTVIYNGNSTVQYDLPEIIEYQSAKYKLFARRSDSASDVSGVLTTQDQTIIYEYELLKENKPTVTPSIPPVKENINPKPEVENKTITTSYKVPNTASSNEIAIYYVLAFISIVATSIIYLSKKKTKNI